MSDNVALFEKLRAAVDYLIVVNDANIELGTVRDAADIIRLDDPMLIEWSDRVHNPGALVDQKTIMPPQNWLFIYSHQYDKHVLAVFPGQNFTHDNPPSDQLMRRVGEWLTAWLGKTESDE